MFVPRIANRAVIDILCMRCCIESTRPSRSERIDDVRRVLIHRCGDDWANCVHKYAN